MKSKKMFYFFRKPKQEASSRLDDKKAFLKKISPGIVSILNTRKNVAPRPTEFYMNFHLMEGAHVSLKRFRMFVDSVRYEVLNDVLLYLDDLAPIVEALDGVRFRQDTEKTYARMIREEEISSFEDFLSY